MDRTEIVFSVGPLEINTDTRIIRSSGRVLNFTPREVSVVIYLARREGRFVTIRELIENVWGQAVDAHGHSVLTTLANIKKKLASVDLGTVLHTQRWLGVMLNNIK